VAEQVAAAKTATFEWCSRQYMAAHEAGWGRHRADWYDGK